MLDLLLFVLIVIAPPSFYFLGCSHGWDSCMRHMHRKYEVRM